MSFYDIAFFYIIRQVTSAQYKAEIQHKALIAPGHDHLIESLSVHTFNMSRWIRTASFVSHLCPSSEEIERFLA